jgi:hypothetical protein
MYAMSVSPLTPELIRQISGDLHSTFVRKGGQPKKKVLQERDYTNFVKIGDEKFEIEYGKKKKKIAVLPFEKIQSTLSSMDMSSLQDYRRMKGKVIYRGGEILGGMSLNRVLQVIPKLGFLDRIVEKWPKGAHFEYVRDSYQIVRYIPSLLQRGVLVQRIQGFYTVTRGVYFESRGPHRRGHQYVEQGAGKNRQ